jgi:HAE1 family hydrophobic/amphiphilic exporter-1
VGGMLTGVLLGVFIIPVLFTIFQFLQEKVAGKKMLEKDEWIMDKLELQTN